MVAKFKYSNKKIKPSTTYKQDPKITWVLKAANKILELAVTFQFINLNDVPEIKLQGDSIPIYILVKIANPIMTTETITQNEPAIFALCKLHHVYSAGLLFAYLIEIPCHIVNVLDNCVTIRRRSAVNDTLFTNAAMSLQNTHLSVFNSPDGGALVCFSSQYKYLSHEVLKGGV